MGAILERMREDMLVRNLATATQRSYIKYTRDYVAYFDRSPEFLDSSHVREFQLHLFQQRKLSWGAFNAAVCALRLPSHALTLPRAAACDACGRILPHRGSGRARRTMQQLRTQTYCL